MPIQTVKENGRTGYRWGNSGKIYWGPGAKAKAALQAQAARAAGYKG